MPASANHGHQRVGVALAAGQLRGAGCVGAESERPERHARSYAMTQAEYATLLARREAARAAYSVLAGQVDAVISVTAPGAAPVGLETTGNPIFVVPGSLLGAPGVSLPVLDDGGLPLGLQVLGFSQGDVGVFAVAGRIEDALQG